MTRLRGRSLGGQRCHGKAPYGKWRSMTMLSSMRNDGSTECMVFEGAINKRLFETYISEILCPKLKPGDIVIMDNLPAHKNPDVRRHIEKCEAKLYYLPPYSPDLNPIENMWSKVKQTLRGLEIREWEGLESGIAQALNQVSANDASGWFKHCGYA